MCVPRKEVRYRCCKLHLAKLYDPYGEPPGQQSWELSIAPITNLFLFANVFFRNMANSLVPKVNLPKFSANFYILANIFFGYLVI
jgi:hypothetical protein